MLFVRAQTSKGVVQVPFDVDTGLDGLKKEIEKECGLHAAHQKLVCKGKVLQEGVPLVEQGVKDGVKVLVLSIDGSGSTAGRIHAEQERQQKKQWQEQKMREAGYNPTGGRTKTMSKVETSSDKSDKWKSTGIVGLCESNLKEIPAVVQQVLDARVLDLDRNELTDIPDVACLTKLQRLRVSRNRLGDVQGVALQWSRLAPLHRLQILVLDDNRIQELSEEMHRCLHLTSFSVRQNRITVIHSTFWTMSGLKRLDLSHNQIRDLHGIGQCTSLEELYLAHNWIEEIPAEVGALKALVCLFLDRNRIASVPPALFLGCTSLHTLSMHGNPLKLEQLRTVDGYAQYDARRRAKHDKQVDMRVFRGPGGFDEGADSTLWRRW